MKMLSHKVALGMIFGCFLLFLGDSYAAYISISSPPTNHTTAFSNSSVDLAK